MKKNIFAFSVLMSACFLAHAKNIYVSVTGSDTNSGASSSTALLTLQKAHELVEPGDVVLIGAGTYFNDTAAEKKAGSALLTITKSGKPDAWITWKAQKGQKPVLRSKAWGAITVTGSYHIIEGLTVTGYNEQIALSDALASVKKGETNPYYNTNGIVLDGRNNAPDNKPHHLIVRNCIVSSMPGAGIAMFEGDHFRVEDNLVFDNAWFTKSRGSGISTQDNWQVDDAPGYHVVIQRNKVWNNKTMVPWEKTGKLSDGNGILLDVTDQTVDNGATNPNADAAVKPTAAASGAANSVDKPKRPVWKARALVANNLSVHNGGSGIHAFRTAHVDIINNTTYWNGSNVGYEELFSNRSDDVVILNNIMVPRPGAKVTSNNSNTNLRWDYNLYPIAQDAVKGPNDIVADPQFIAPYIDVRDADFSVKMRSKAVDSGTNDMPQEVDIDRNERLIGARRDRGAYEQ